MEARSDGDTSSSSIRSQSRNGIAGVFLVAQARPMASAEKPRASGTSASTANSANCPVAAMGAAAGRWREAASSVVLVPEADVDVSVRDINVVVCVFVVLVCVCEVVVVDVAVPVGVEDVGLVAVDDEVRVVVHDAAAAPSSVVAFVKRPVSALLSP